MPYDENGNREPRLEQQAFLFHRGYYFVRYPDGNVSGCMPKSYANDYANIFGGQVCKHSRAPRIRDRWWQDLMILAVGAVIIVFGLRYVGVI